MGLEPLELLEALEPVQATFRLLTRAREAASVRAVSPALASRVSGQKRAATAPREWLPGCAASHANNERARALLGSATGAPSSSSVI